MFNNKGRYVIKYFNNFFWLQTAKMGWVVNRALGRVARVSVDQVVTAQGLSRVLMGQIVTAQGRGRVSMGQVSTAPDRGRVLMGQVVTARGLGRISGQIVGRIIVGRVLTARALSNVLNCKSKNFILLHTSFVIVSWC